MILNDARIIEHGRQNFNPSVLQCQRGIYYTITCVNCRSQIIIYCRGRKSPLFFSYSLNIKDKSPIIVIPNIINPVGGNRREHF